MALSIHTNVNSINAQRNLNITLRKLNTASARLTSGFRINSAKDDAAGMAISTRFSTQLMGLAQARRNASDGISLAQTAESALDEVTNNLQRIRELAVQATNGNYSDSDRATLNREVQQRLAEVNRIATQTNFNGIKVLDGSARNLSFQVGSNVGEVITVDIEQGVRANQIGSLAKGRVDVSSVFSARPAFTGAQAAATDWTTANGAGLGTTTYDGIDVDWSGYTGATADDAKAFLQGALGADYTVEVNADGSTLDITRAAGAGGKVTLGAGDLSLSVAGGASFDITGTFSSTQDVVDAINRHSREGVSAYVGTDGSLRLSGTGDIRASGAQATPLGFAAEYRVDATASLADVSVANRDVANETIGRVNAALESVSALRSTLGAVQARFDSTIGNLDAISQNLADSRAVIRDADFGEESFNKTNAMILQQAGISVLAQANSSQQMVLKLLE
ncbi:flagellin [Luteibacter sp. Sphag1AF]|uniref:flagellin N-terminal helical domain-containing protein n=1 Tax=Luteibacter sp. Sphag1AF TaxID=2587031 RepID=UPI00161C1D2F|nr:flagellin [Luteibacter sp. Sphag1AF]